MELKGEGLCAHFAAQRSCCPVPGGAVLIIKAGAFVRVAEEGQRGGPDHCCKGLKHLMLVCSRENGRGCVQLRHDGAKRPYIDCWRVRQTENYLQQRCGFMS